MKYELGKEYGDESMTIMGDMMSPMMKKMSMSGSKYYYPKLDIENPPEQLMNQIESMKQGQATISWNMQKIVKTGDGECNHVCLEITEIKDLKQSSDSKKKESESRYDEIEKGLSESERKKTKKNPMEDDSEDESEEEY